MADSQSAFAPTPVKAARISSASSDPTVTVELEVPTREIAEQLQSQYDGVAADGNTLRVTIIRQGLKDRMGNGHAVVPSRPAAAGTSRGTELLGSPATG